MVIPQLADKMIPSLFLNRKVGSWFGQYRRTALRWAKIVVRNAHDLRCGLVAGQHTVFIFTSLCVL